MKKILLLPIYTALCHCCFSQLIQASLGPGTDSTRVKIYLKPSATQTPANISTLQFNIGIDTAIKPTPVMTVVSSALAGVTWTITEAAEGGYNNYQLTTATSPVQPNTVANTEFQVMELMFSNGPVTSQNVSLITLPDGGTGASLGNSIFLCTGSFTSDGENLYYARPGVSVNNNFSYDETGAIPGLLTSSATISGIILPVTWLDFAVQQKDNNALLQWKVAKNEYTNYFEIERSFNGRTFSSIGKIKNNSSLSVESYKYTDEKINELDTKVIFYRLKQIDVNGQTTYSDVRLLKLSPKLQIALYPNPAKEGFYLRITNENAGAKKITLKLRNNLSQVVDTRKISETQALSYYYNISRLLQNGNYVLEIYMDQQLIDSKNILFSK